VAVTVKKSDVLVFTDPDGNELATVILNEKQVGKVALVVTADRSIHIHRRKADQPKGIA
jgi:hypothetical protein